MLIPNDFYYLEKIGADYAREAPGALNVSRLIKDQKAWLQPQSLTEKKKKKLFITDATAESWSQYQIYELTAVLKNLLEEGFEIYLKQNDDVIALDNVTMPLLFSDNTRKRIKSGDPEQFDNKIANELRFTKDEIQFLDDYWINILRDENVIKECNNGKYPVPRYILTQDDTADEIDLLWKQGKRDLVQDSFEPDICFNVYGSENINIPITIDLKRMEMVFEYEIMYEHLNRRGVYIAEYGSITQKQISKIEEVWYDGEVNFKEVWQLLRLIDSLKNLDMSGKPDVDFNIEEIDFEFIDLSSLIQLNLACLENYTKVNIEFLQHAVNLKILLFGVFSEDSVTPIIQYIPKTLEVLDLSVGDVSMKSIVEVLGRCPSLETLELNCCTLTMDVEDYQYEGFDNLKNLVVHAQFDKEPEGDVDILFTFLSLCHNLQSLRFSQYTLPHLFCSSTERKQYQNLSVTHLYLDNLVTNSNASQIDALRNLIPLLPNLKYVYIDSSLAKLIMKDSKYDMKTALKNMFFGLQVFVHADTDKGRKKIEEVPTEPDHMEIEKKLDVNAVYQKSDILVQSLSMKPPDPNFKFTYKGKNKTINQTMIIEKLSQYLTLIGKYTEIIPKLNKGMCAVLADQFLSISEEQWNVTLAHIGAWDGKRDSLDIVLHSMFNSLTLKYIDTYYKGKASISTYIGDDVSQWLVKNRRSVALGNNWHKIAVKYVSDNEWIFYDPNNQSGYESVTAEQLKHRIEKSLGPIAYVMDLKLSVFPVILDKPSFIRNGGLLTLCQADKYLQLLSQMPAPTTLAIQDFAGLLLRNVQDTPAWVMGLQKGESVSQYTLALLCEFTKNYPDEAFDHLIQSISDITARDKYYLIEKLLQMSNHPAINYTTADTFNFVDGLIGKIHGQYQKNTLEKVFTTWETSQNNNESVNEFLQRLTAAKGGKHLIECRSPYDVKALQTALQLSSTRPVFYVNSPYDLICYGTRIVRDGTRGRLHTGYGGAFYDFLNQHNDPANPPLIIINYANFKADEIVKFNTILDAKREIDRFPIPECASIIGINNTNKPDCYRGSDFYSRFDLTTSCPFNSAQLAEAKSMPALFTEFAPGTPVIVINLFHEADWKERLLGRWILQGDQLLFQEGELITALKNQSPVDIRNGLWDDEEFKLFWDQARIKGRFEYEGMTVDIPANFKIARSSGYARELREYSENADTLSTGHAEIVNASLLSHYFVTYRCDDQHQLHTLPGIIERNAGKTISVIVSHELSQNQWAMLLTECQKHHVKLTCYRPPIMSLPPERLKTESTCVIQTNDIDATVASLKKDVENCIILNISECEASDLLTKLDGKLLNGSRFEFNEREQALLKALNSGVNVILKGTFCSRLAESLAPLLINRLREGNQKSKLICVTENADGFRFMPVNQQQVTRNDLHQLLGPNFNAVIKEYPDDDFGKLNARIHHLQSLPDHPDPWQGVYHLDNRSKSHEFDYQNYQAIADQFDKERLNRVGSVLKNNRFALLTGLTGVGKSTFVEKFLKSDETRTLYHGKENKLAWATDKSSKRKILFLDEANMSGTDWSEFDGTGILIDGQYRELTDECEIVFACNPMSYGGERKLPELFAKHGNAIVFEPMPKEYIYANILLPILQHSAIQQYSLQISTVILQYYQFFCDRSTDEILISPRELQMMALLVISHYDRNPHCDLKAITEYYASLIATPLVPDNYIEDFQRQFNHDTPIQFSSPIPVHDPRFIITASREPIANYLSDLLSLREQRSINTKMNDAQRYGGLGGVILEGDPGVGKSELVINLLLARGYREGSLTHDEPGGKIFYKIPVNLQVPEKIRLILKAFNEGAVIMMDEINSSPMLEELLNDLLMGKAPGGKRPLRPGSVFIGTQNPMTQQGRFKLSSATTHRVSVINVPNYPKQEITQILVNYGLSKREAEAISAAFIKQLILAKQQGYTPAPTFRNLLRLADKVLQSRQRELNHMANTIDPKNPDMVLVGEQLQQYFAKLPEERSQLLLTLLRNHDYEIARRLLTLNADFNINAVDLIGWTPLHYAVSSGDIDLVNAVLKHHPDVNVFTRGYYVYSPLQMAVDEGYGDIVQTLMQVPGIKVNDQADLSPGKLSMFNTVEKRKKKKLKGHNDDDHDIDMRDFKPGD